MKHYDQTKDNKTKYACTIYTMLNIIKYDYGVEIKDDMIFTIVAYMERIGVLLPKGAYFSVIYPAMCKYISFKTWLKLKVKESTITWGLDSFHTWGLWAKRLSSLSIALAKDDWKITVEDMQKIAAAKKGSGHNHAVKESNKNSSWILLESWWGFIYKTSLKALREWVKLWIYYDKARTIVPADEKACKIQTRCVKAAKRKKRFLTYWEFKNIASKVK